MQPVYGASPAASLVAVQVCDATEATTGLKCPDNQLQHFNNTTAFKLFGYSLK